MDAEAYDADYGQVFDVSARAIDRIAERKGDPKRLARLLKQHREALADMRVADSAIATALYEAAGKGLLVIEGVGTFDCKSGAKRKRFDNERLVSTFAARLADTATNVDRDTGEIPPTAVVVERACRTMAKATGAATESFSGWRVGVAKDLGVDLDGFHEWETGSPSVIIR